MAKRTRPGKRPREIQDIVCCQPYPYAHFVNQTLVSVQARHRGEECSGATETIPLEAWNAEIDRRAAMDIHEHVPQLTRKRRLELLYNAEEKRVRGIGRFRGGDDR